MAKQYLESASCIIPAVVEAMKGWGSRVLTSNTILFVYYKYRSILNVSVSRRSPLRINFSASPRKPIFRYNVSSA